MIPTNENPFQNYTLESLLGFECKGLKRMLHPHRRKKTAAQIPQRNCGHGPLIQSLTLIPSPTNVSIAVSPLPLVTPLLTPLTVFILRLIHTPTHRRSHFRLTLILLSVFIYLYHPVLSLPDYINTPSCSPLFHLSSSLSSPPPSALPSHWWMMQRSVEGPQSEGAGLRWGEQSQSQFHW